MKYLIIVSALLGAALLYLLSSASANTDLFSHNYSTLLMLTAGLALSLSVLVGYQFWQLLNKLRQRIYGAKLTLRLALFFSMIAILPGVLVYAVSVQFLGKSIESWFDIRVENALEGGLNLGRNSLENELKVLGKKGQLIAMILVEQTPDQYKETLARLIDKGESQGAALFDAKGRVKYSVGARHKAIWNSVDIELLRQTEKQGSYRLIDVLPDNRLVLRVLISVRPAPEIGSPFILHLVQPVSEQFAADAEMVQTVYRDYQQLSLSRLGLKRLYGITLTLSLLIVLLSAISAAIYLSARLSAPLAVLAEGTRAVAKGDYSTAYPVQSNDELGALTGLFNQMTVQLADAKKLSEQQQQQVENAKTFLENVLTHLSSGVIVLDEKHLLLSANSSAEQILGFSLQSHHGRALAEIALEQALFRSFELTLSQAFDESGAGVWQRQIERLSKNGNQILLLKGMTISSIAEKSLVVVFDDITHLLQAERQAAWGEVARRLAHEIKNPLTPIQLSAERLQHKLSNRLGEQDAILLQRATQTIVSQVTAMKNMVSDFADYARAPSPKLSALDMHQLLHEVMGLYEANSRPIHVQLEADRSWINGDATRLRQVIHNLLQNAYDALHQAVDPKILLSTQNPALDKLLVSVQDNGCGIPEQVLAKIFEPYMTTKTKGTGLGLPIVKKIIEEHGGHITVENRESGGTRVNVLLPLIPEKETS